MKHPFFIIICVICSAVCAQHEKMYIGVADLAGQNVDESSTAIISDRLRTALFSEGGLTVLERSAMREVLKEQGFQQTGCTSDECAVEIGQLLGVNYMVVGTVGKLGRLYTIDIRLIQVATGKIAFSTNVDCDCPVEKVLTNSVITIAQRISQHVNKQPSTGKPTPPAAPRSVSTSTDTAGSRRHPARARTELRKPILKRPALQLSVGAFALGAGIAGILFDRTVQHSIETGSELKSTYRTLTDGDTQYDAYESRLRESELDARRFSQLRTISYVLAGVGATGLIVTFFF